MTRTLPRIMIAGASSGTGKTTLTAGLTARWRSTGLAVQAFKCGPDYIDPSYHTLAAGRPCRSLDPWLLAPTALRESFGRATRDAQLAVIEGVMGLFDGFGYIDGVGSSAQVAVELGVPVVVVLDIQSVARSAAATALGFVTFDPSVNVAGFILNRAGSSSHGDGVAQAVESATGRKCFGWLPRADALQIPERHLGLVPTAESGEWEGFISAASSLVGKHLDLDALLQTANSAPGWHEPAAISGQRPSAPSPQNGTGQALRVAVARDEAFSFYYEDNLDLLAELGAEVVPFSPLRDHALPAGTSGLYLGGGFPELYADRLSANSSLRSELARAIATGLPTYAECGGLMYLTESIRDLAGQVHPMVAALPGRSEMTGRLMLGYREVEMLQDTLLGPAGTRLRGHEFHYSAWEAPAGRFRAYRLQSRLGADDSLEGFASANLLASYVHLHWGGAPQCAAAFVSATRAYHKHHVLE